MIKAIKTAFTGSGARGYRWKIELDGEVISASAKRENAEAEALAVIKDALKYRSNEPLTSAFSDGSLFVCQQNGEDAYTLWRFGGNRSTTSSECGQFRYGYKSLKDYFVFVCGDYARATGATQIGT